MRMPYIGGRGPDYTTKLNLMYNWRGAFRGGGVAGRHPLARAMSAENDTVR